MQILGYTSDAVVSSDFNTCPLSSVVDATAGIQLTPNFVKVRRWAQLAEWPIFMRPLAGWCFSATDSCVVDAGEIFVKLSRRPMFMLLLQFQGLVNYKL